jgi:hypothetical protein
VASQTREQRYLEAKRALDDAASCLARLDEEIVDVAGAMAFWRASWRQTHDPEAAVRQVLAQRWPARGEIERAFEAWLTAYRDAVDSWGMLPSEAQLRLEQPSRS